MESFKCILGWVKRIIMKGKWLKQGYEKHLWKSIFYKLNMYNLKNKSLKVVALCGLLMIC